MDKQTIFLRQNASYQVQVMARGGLPLAARMILTGAGFNIHPQESGEIRYSASGPIVATTDYSNLSTGDLKRLLEDQFDVQIVGE